MSPVTVYKVLRVVSGKLQSVAAQAFPIIYPPGEWVQAPANPVLMPIFAFANKQSAVDFVQTFRNSPIYRMLRGPGLEVWLAETTQTCELPHPSNYVADPRDEVQYHQPVRMTIPQPDDRAGITGFWSYIHQTLAGTGRPVYIDWVDPNCTFCHDLRLTERLYKGL